jgi:hypothetical protein
MGERSVSVVDRHHTSTTQRVSYNISQKINRKRLNQLKVQCPVENKAQLNKIVYNHNPAKIFQLQLH